MLAVFQRKEGGAMKKSKKSINLVFILGTVTSVPTTTSSDATQDAAACEFNVTDGENLCTILVVTKDKVGMACSKHIAKGCEVFVEGQLRYEPIGIGLMRHALYADRVVQFLTHVPVKS